MYAVYNADATGSSSLKTSLFAAYNGESNANDSFGSNNGTAVGGLTYTSGKIGDAFQFNGTNAYVSLPNNSFNPTGDFTISAWVNFADNTGYNVIYSSYSSGGTWGNGVDFFREGATNNWSFILRNAVNIVLFRTPGIGGPTNKWSHMVVVRVVGQDPKFYMNGSLVTGTFYTFGNSSINPSYGANQICNIGSQNNGSLLGNFKQDGTSLWNRALTQAEITELYNSGNGAQYITDNFYKPTTNDALNTYNGAAQGGLTYGVGKVGTAFQFNGTNAYVQLGDVMDVGTSSWSYSMWFNTAVSTTNQVLFSKSLAAGLVGRFTANLENNKVKFFLEVSSGSIAFIETVNTISINTWYNVVFVVDRSNRLQIYLNGTLQSVNRTGILDLAPYSASNLNTNCPFRIGAYTASDNTTALLTFNGSIDAFNIWNRVLTQSEITELYNSGNGKQYTI